MYVQPLSVFSLCDNINAVIRGCDVLIKHLRDGQTSAYQSLEA